MADKAVIVNSIDNLKAALDAARLVLETDYAEFERKKAYKKNANAHILSRVCGFFVGIFTGFLGGLAAGFTRPGYSFAPITNVVCAVFGAVFGMFRGMYLGAKHGVTKRNGLSAPVWHTFDIFSKRTYKIPGMDNSSIDKNRRGLYKQYLMFREDHIHEPGAIPAGETTRSDPLLRADNF